MKTKRLRTFATIIQSVLILAMMALVTSMIVQINCLQGTARVINYAGIVRGATQREVKLEIVGQKNDELIAYLDDILEGLKYESRKYNLVSLQDETYQSDLDAQMEYWKQLKAEIYCVRESGYEATNIVEVSEKYFQMADETVSAAEKYSESIATIIRYLEIVTAVDITILILIMLARSLDAVRIRHRNHQLEQKAFTDQHTGLPNKGRREEFFNDSELMQNPIACVVFDLNNLKKANDTLGHSVGDQLIANFARLLRNAIPASNFVGRYGGDEFMVVIYDASRQKVEAILGQLQFEVIQYRLENEYNAKCRWEPVHLHKACWIEADDEKELENFKKRKYQYMAKDIEGRDVFLADSGYVLSMAQQDFEHIKFHFTSEF